HAITTDAWRNSLDHYQEFVIIVALDLKIEGPFYLLVSNNHGKNVKSRVHLVYYSCVQNFTQRRCHHGSYN
ncbi:hypothetical protein EFP44_05655, partial [Lacticaseibacillus paracasei]|nr:hypothetical protein [Lacticaseibacillus paracasei]